MLFPQVLKFGGAALRDGAAVRRVCDRIASVERPAVVVSAHHGVTALLHRAAREAADGRLGTEPIRVRHRSLLSQLGLDAELLDRHFADLFGVLASIRDTARLEPEALDFVLSFGERMSARIVAATLRARGVTAAPLDAFDLGLLSDSRHGFARPLPGTGERLRASLEQVEGVPVVTGFLARDAAGRLTTLGPNGSDLSASLVAEAVGALELVFFKTVPGVMSADPARVPNARVLERLSFAEAAALAAHGAEVLHPTALAPVERASIRVRVADVGAPDAPGTRISADAPEDGPRALAVREPLHALRVPLPGGAGRAEDLARALRALAEHDVEPALATAVGATLVVLAEDADALGRAARALGAEGPAQGPLSALTAVGRGGAACSARMQGALAREGLEPRLELLAVDALARTVVVDAADGARALRALHAALFEAPELAR